MAAMGKLGKYPEPEELGNWWETDPPFPAFVPFFSD